MYMHVIDQIMEEEKNKKKDLLEDEEDEYEEVGFLSTFTQLIGIGDKEKMFLQYMTFVLIFAISLYGVYKYFASDAMIKF